MPIRWIARRGVGSVGSRANSMISGHLSSEHPSSEDTLRKCSKNSVAAGMVYWSEEVR